MIFHENRLLADDSREISPYFFRKLEKMSQNVSSVAVVIGALRINIIYWLTHPIHLMSVTFNFIFSDF